MEKSKYSQQEWYTASESTSNILNQKLKETNVLLFYKGAIYTCTFNHSNGSFSHSQMVFLFEIPTQDTLDNWQKIKVLVAPPGMKEIIYDENEPTDRADESGYGDVR